MKRVLYVIPGLNPLYKDGASNRVNSFINCFKQEGYSVHVLALPIYKDYLLAIKHKKDYSKNATWHILPHIHFIGKRWLNIYSLLEKFYILMLTLCYRCDIVLADYALGGSLARWAKLYSKLIVNHRGDSIDEFKCGGQYDDNDIRIKNHKRYLRDSIKNADASICVSENLRIQLSQYTNMELKNTFIFPCCADISRFENLVCTENNERIVLGYFGGFNKWQCIDVMLDIFIELQQKDPRFYLLILTNSDYSSYKEKLALIGDGNYTIKGVSFDKIPENVAKMDLSFALRENRPLNIVSSPTKLSESLAAGVPLIVTKASGDYEEMCVNGKNAFVFDDLNYDSKSIDELYQYCIRVHKNRKEIFDICRESVKDRTWNNYVKQFHQFINEQL